MKTSKICVSIFETRTRKSSLYHYLLTLESRNHQEIHIYQGINERVIYKRLEFQTRVIGGPKEFTLCTQRRKSYLGINILKPVPMKFSGLQLKTWGSSKERYIRNCPVNGLPLKSRMKETSTGEMTVPTVNHTGDNHCEKVRSNKL